MGVSVAPDLRGWTPTAVRFDDGTPVVRCCYTDGIAFSDPVFDQTIDRALRDPFRLLFWREELIEAVAAFASDRPGLAPSGFVFHMSRCGSTLVAQMLAALPEVLVISEAGPIDAILRGPAGEGDVVRWLRAIVSLLGQGRRAEQSSLVVKFDAWAILQLPLIRAAFPDTPCVFVYRDPVEVIVSHLDRRGYHTVPNTLPPDLLGFAPGELASLSGAPYVAAVVGRLCAAAAAAARDGDVTLIEYGSLPDAVPDTIAPLFGLAVGPRDRQTLAASAALDAKNPSLAFESDRDAKRRRAGADVRSAAADWAAPAYDELERLRLRVP